MNIQKTIYQSIAVTTLLFTSISASAGLVYSNDFDGNEFEASGISSTLSGGNVEGVQGYSALAGFDGNFLRNSSLGNPASSTTFSFTGLGDHTSISIEGLLAVIDSWDSSENSCCSPDLLGVKVDGTLITSATFNNAIGNTNTAFGTSLTGGTSPANTYNNIGFSGWGEQAFDFSGYAPLTDIAHTASTLTVEFFAYGAGWQGGTDESYALENIAISTNGVDVPEPSTLAIFALGVLGLASRRFKNT